MESLCFRDKDRLEQVRIARAVDHIERSADRYAAIGLLAIASELRKLAAKARFSSFSRITEDYRAIFETLQAHLAIKSAGLFVEQDPKRIATAPADRYIPASDLCVIVAFFNPCHSNIRTSNCQNVLRTLSSSGAHWRCIECAFDDEPFELPNDINVLHVRSRSVLWQKERLLNALIDTLPDQFTKVAWIDADVCFSNPSWLTDTSSALDQYVVIQPFEHALRLRRGPNPRLGDADQLTSFAARFAREPWGVAGNNFWNHGHPGYAWAGQRGWLQHERLYDAALSGTADHLMAHAFVGTWECPCIYDRIAIGPRWDHFKDWCRRVYPSVRCRLGFVPGTVLGLWHGSHTRDEAYYHADHHLDALRFHPCKDLRLGASGAWEWANASPLLQRWALDYFEYRDSETTGQNLKME